MILAWVGWFWLAPLLYWLDRVCALTLADGTVIRLVEFDLGVAFVAAVLARTATLPGILACAAVARSLLDGGPVALHLLTLALPVAALLPLRAVFVRRSLWRQIGTAAALAVLVPRIFGLFARLSATAVPMVHAVPAPSLLTVGVAMVVVPLFGMLLGFLPPLSAFVERSAE